jgi:transcriptional regulator with XRE-family HTH domain
MLMNFAKNIIVARKKLGISQQELADRLGVRQSTIANYETGIRTPSLKELDHIAKVLKIEPGDLLK